MKRCAWARSPAMIEYHDREWGVPVHDDRVLFEFLTLEGAQAGLSWETILNKREAYRRAFADFDVAKVARFTAARRAKLMRDPGIVRNRLKIESTVTNAAAFLKVQREFGSFDAFLWNFVGAKPERRRTQQGTEAPRLPLRRHDDLLRIHAGRRDRERPCDRLLPPPEGMSLVDPQVLAFALVAALMTMVPGADTFLVVRNSLRGGRRDGWLTVTGICTGLFVHALLSALGVSAVIAHSATAFLVLKVAGAGYLAWLGLQSLRRAAARRARTAGR